MNMQQGMTADKVLATMQGMKVHDAKVDDGRLFGLAFIADDEGRKLAEAAHNLFMWENALDPMVFPSLLQFEKDVIAFAVKHLGGNEETVGSFTSGGTESCMLAVKTARDWAREHRPDVTKPKMILPISAHPAFHKAAAYFGIDTVITPVDAVSCKADVAAMRSAIDDQTILLVASAPSYPHGAMDPIEDIAAIAQEHALLFHVDGCIGGFVLPYLRELGVPVPRFDFSVPGVTSMSMDFHKYAYAPKGSSVVLYKDAELRRHQFFTHSAWPGYTMVNPTMQSSKSGGPLAGTWALLNYYGHEGYLAIARKIKDSFELLLAGLAQIDGVKVMGDPAFSLIGITTEGVSVFAVCDKLTAKGWVVHPQMGIGDLPASFHLTVMPLHLPMVESFLADLAAAVAEAREPVASDNALLAMLADIDLSELTSGEMEELLVSSGLVGNSGGPMAEVNEILDKLSPEVKDKIVKGYYDLLSRPAKALEACAQ